MTTEIHITRRSEDKRPLSGWARLPSGITRDWERSGSTGYLRIRIAGPRDPFASNDKEEALIRRAIGKDPDERQWRRNRRAERTNPWPLEPIPKPDSMIELSGRSFPSPITSENIGMVRDLREAARQGNDFKEMMASISDAGFDIMPAISQNQKDGRWSLNGFRFSRDGIHVSASHAGLMLLPMPDQERAPDLDIDGPALMALKERYAAKYGDAEATARRMRAELRDIRHLGLGPYDQAELLVDKGFQGQISERRIGGERRNIYTLEREGVVITLTGLADRSLMHSVRHMGRILDRAAKPEADMAHCPSP